MLNLQNNSTFPYIFCPKMLTRGDGKIVCAWIESAGSTLASIISIRIGFCIMNEDGTMYKATSYTPTISTNASNLLFNNGIDFLIGSSNEIYLFIITNNGSTYKCFRYYKLDDGLNIVSTYDGTGLTIVSYQTANPAGNIFFINKEKTKICIFKRWGSDNSYYDGMFCFDTISNSTSTINIYNSASSTLSTSWYDNQISPINSSDIGIIQHYSYHTGSNIWNNVRSLDSTSTVITSLTGLDFSKLTAMRGFNTIKYIFGISGASLYYVTINGTSTVVSSNNFLLTSISSGSPYVTSFCKFSTNNIYITTADGYLHKLEQDLSTGELTLINSTTLTNGYIITASNNSLVAMNSINPKNVIIIEKESLNKSPIIDLSSSSGFTVSNLLTTGYIYSGTSTSYVDSEGCKGLHNGNMIYNSLPCSLNQNLDFHNLMIANNGPGSVNNINYQKSSLVMGFLSSGEHKSINYVYNLSSFKFTPNYTKPAGTDLKFYYSLNNGVSWTICPEDTVVSVPGSTQIIIKADFSTTDNTVSPVYLDYALVLYT